MTAGADFPSGTGGYARVRPTPTQTADRTLYLPDLAGTLATYEQLKVLDRAYAEYTTNADITGLIPFDDTIPQNTEGTQILSVTLTPKSVTSRVRLRFQGQIVGGFVNYIAAIFSSASSNALRSGWATLDSSYAGPLVLEHEYVPGVTTTLTFSVRIGTQSGTTMRLNGTSGGRLFGGSAGATLVVEEIAP